MSRGKFKPITSSASPRRFDGTAKADRLGGPKIDREPEPVELLDRQVLRAPRL